MAVADAEEMLAQAPQPDLETATVLAWFYWYRCLEAAEQYAYAEALRTSARLFFRVRELAPQAVLPPLVDQLYAAHAIARKLDTASAAALVRDASRSRDPDVLEWTITVLIQAEALAAESGAHADRVVYRCLQGHQRYVRYELLGLAEDLDMSVADLSDAVRHAPEDLATAAVMRGYLGRAHLRRYQLHGGPEDLEAALTELRQAYQGLDLLGPGDPEWLAPAQNLGGVLLLASQYVEAIAVLRRVLLVHPRGSLDAGQTHLMLGNACRHVYLAHGRPQDLDECVHHLRTAYAVPLSAPGVEQLREDAAPELAAALGDLYDRDGDGQHLDEASEMMRECLGRADGPQARVHLLIALAEMHYSFYHRTGNRSELTAAITAAEEVLRRAAVGTDASLSALWESATSPTLAQALCDRFRLEPEPHDLDRAVETAQRGVQLSDPDGPNTTGLVSCLMVLGYALALRAETSGSRDDTDDAVEALTKALDFISADSPQRGHAHVGLGNALRVRAAMFGDVGDLDAAIAAYREAGAAEADHFTQNGLATALLDRFQYRGGHADLDEGIALSRAAARVAPEHERHTALHLTGVFLRRRFVHVGNPRDLDEAIEAGAEAVRAVPIRHRLRPAYLSSLALTYGICFRERGQHRADSDVTLDPLLQAIELLAEALDATPPGHRSRPGLLANLADALADRFEATSRWADHQAALTCVTEALKECPAERAERAQLLCLRARLLISGAEARPGPATAADRASAVETLREAAEVATAPPRLRLMVLRELARQASDPADALAAYDQAVTCVPLIAWHGLDRRDRERHLTHIGALTQEAAAAALDAGYPERAVELLEHGRAVLWGQALDTDPDLDAVRRAAPELAERLDQVRARLLALDADPASPGTASVGRTDLRMSLAREWDALCEHVRRHVPGCADFLHPPGFAHLRTAATNGTVVLINIAERRSDALALTPDRLQVISLPRLNPQTVQQHVTDYMNTLESFKYTDLLGAIGLKSDAHGQLDWLNLRMSDVLDWLWDAVAEPVLDALGHVGEPTDSAWPRVWWCPTGPLAFLPFHAAGRYRPTPRPGECVLDRVVSSNTPTLRALIQTRGRLSAAPERPRMLVVAMPETPGRPSLPDAEEDIESVTNLFPDRTTVVAGPEATRGAVCRALRDHSWAHFSCHGHMEPYVPSRSGLQLHDGTLTVTDLARLRLDHAEVAFLSSCTTTLSGYDLPDEAIHVSAALQFAGYRHVVSTMWTSLGRYASFIADHLYDSLAANGELDPEECALALHHAVRALRAQPGMELAIWTPFVHTGP
ncbi:CHAT domain-containing protein [Streptomyces atratus]|uniref:CHAT domain-containing protein n=1 Tax=Streptomyces atratus TaxID=1893 RepID=UPI0036A40500